MRPTGESYQHPDGGTTASGQVESCRHCEWSVEINPAPEAVTITIGHTTNKLVAVIVDEHDAIADGGLGEPASLPPDPAGTRPCARRQVRDRKVSAMEHMADADLYCDPNKVDGAPASQHGDTTEIPFDAAASARRSS